MSSTRHASADAPLSQNRFMSAPEFAELRGINGSAVTVRASILPKARERNLLYWLQAISLEPGGLAHLVGRLVNEFPERLKPVDDGPVEMLDLRGDDVGPRRVTVAERAAWNKKDEEENRAKALALLEAFIVELCINPRIEFSAHQSKAPYFNDLIGALFEMQVRWAKQEAADFVPTAISDQIGKVMSEALRHPGRIYILEGKSGVGKSRAALEWCRRNAGVARYISLPGVMSKTAFFRLIARALGLGAGYMRKANEMQGHVEDVLQHSKLMLCIDEAAYMCPQGQRLYRRPELIDWLYTALANFNVPTVLLETSMLAQRISMAEKQTVWNSGQFLRRSKWIELPQALSLEELERIAANQIPECGRKEARFAARYASSSKFPMTEVRELIADARELAGEKPLTLQYLDRAIRECRVPSERTQTRAFEPRQRSRRSPDVCNEHAEPAQAVCNEPEETMQKQDLGLSSDKSRAGLGRVNSPVLAGG